MKIDVHAEAARLLAVHVDHIFRSAACPCGQPKKPLAMLFCRDCFGALPRDLRAPLKHLYRRNMSMRPISSLLYADHLHRQFDRALDYLHNKRRGEIARARAGRTISQEEAQETAA